VGLAKQFSSAAHTGHSQGTTHHCVAMLRQLYLSTCTMFAIERVSTHSPVRDAHALLSPLSTSTSLDSPVDGGHADDFARDARRVLRALRAELARIVAAGVRTELADVCAGWGGGGVGGWRWKA
jgi:hypothetical protein